MLSAPTWRRNRAGGQGEAVHSTCDHRGVETLEKLLGGRDQVFVHSAGIYADAPWLE